MTIFIFQTDQKNACRPCCGQPCGRSWKEMWVSFTQTAWMNVSQPEKTANRNVPWCERFCILPLSERKTLRHETELAFNATNVDPASWVGAKKWLIYTRHIYFPNNLCKQLCSDTELCLKRAQVNGPSMSVMVDKQLISKLGLWRHSGDQVAPSMMDRAQKISSSPAPVTWSQSGDQELCLQTLFQFTRAVKLGISGARRNDENKGPMSSFCVYCQSTCL